MKKLFFTTTAPRHVYKSEKVFYLFQRLRYINFFGKNRANNKRTVYKRMLVMKQFFKWYYTFLSNKHFFRVMKYAKQKNGNFIGLFYRFLTLLELHIQVVLVRSFAIPNLILAAALLRTNLLFLNGHVPAAHWQFVKRGDVLEILVWQIFWSFKFIYSKYQLIPTFTNQIFSQVYRSRFISSRRSDMVYTI